MWPERFLWSACHALDIVLRQLTFMLCVQFWVSVLALTKNLHNLHLSLQAQSQLIHITYFNIKKTCILSADYIYVSRNSKSIISMCRSRIMCSWGALSSKISDILLQLLPHTWYTLTTVSPSGSLWCWGCRASGVGSGGWCSSESLESVCMTRDTREMIGAGAPVVVCWERSRCLR